MEIGTRNVIVLHQKMEGFLGNRELVVFSLVTECHVSPEKFKTTLEAERIEWTNWSLEKKEVLPDGTKHGIFEKTNAKGVGGWKTKAERNYKFGVLHGKLSLTRTNGEFERKYNGHFVDGVAHGDFFFSSKFLMTGQEISCPVVYDMGLPKTKDGIPFLWGNKELQFQQRKFTELSLSERPFPTTNNFFPLGEGHAWSVVSLSKYGKSLYGRDEFGARWRIWVPIFRDEIFCE